MFKTDVVLAPRTVNVRVVVDPARILVNSLMLLNQTDSRSGLGDWIVNTANYLPEELARNNAVAWHLVDLLPISDEPEELPSLLARAESHDFAPAIQSLVKHVAEKANRDPSEVLSSRESYVSLVNEIYAKKGDDHDLSYVGLSYDLLIDPEAAKRFLLDHMQIMWERYLRDEWQRVRPVLVETAAMCEQLDLSDLTPLEAIQAVTGRDMTEFWHEEDGVEELVFIPSTHTGPYITNWGSEDKIHSYIIFGARVPEGIVSPSTELSLRDLLIQFEALADDTRLHILTLLTQHRELCSQDFQQMLNLSQSATSRHLRQLVATGYLNERRRDLNKYFSLNTRRVHETSAAMRMLLSRK